MTIFSALQVDQHRRIASEIAEDLLQLGKHRLFVGVCRNPDFDWIRFSETASGAASAAPLAVIALRLRPVVTMIAIVTMIAAVTAASARRGAAALAAAAVIGARSPYP